MKNNTEELSLYEIDLYYLKEKGLSSIKISEMTGIPDYEIDNYLQYQEQYKEHSGVF